MKSEKSNNPLPARPNLKLWEITGIIIPVTLTILMLAVRSGALDQRFVSSGPYQRDYEGIIVEKFLNPRESEQGSSTKTALLIKGKRGDQFTIVVSPDLYDRAAVGRWIRSSTSGVELPQPKHETLR
jgi:hypothetical protein